MKNNIWILVNINSYILQLVYGLTLMPCHVSKICHIFEINKITFNTQCCQYTMLSIHNVVNTQCCHVVNTQCCQYTMLSIHNVVNTQCCQYTMLSIHNVVNTQCCSFVINVTICAGACAALQVPSLCMMYYDCTTYIVGQNPDTCYKYNE